MNEKKLKFFKLFWCAPYSSENTVSYNSDPLLCFDNNTAEALIKSY